MTALRHDGVSLAEQLRAGDVRVVRILYERYARRVQTVAFRIIAEIGEAEDLVQETFMDAWNRRMEFDPARGTVLTWILAIVRTRSLTRLRSRRSAQRRNAATASQEMSEALEGPALLQHQQERKCLLRALARLPREQRRAIELAYFEGLSQREIAVRTGDPLGTVKTRIRLGMQKLSVHAQRMRDQ